MKLKPENNNSKTLNTNKLQNTLGVVITGLLFGTNVNANDPNEWERWDQNNPDENKNQENIPNTKLPGDDSLGNGSEKDPYQANQNGDNNQNENKQNTIFNNNSNTTNNTTTASAGWAIFGAIRTNAYAGSSDYTFKGDFTPTAGGTPADTNPSGAVTLNLTDSNGRSTTVNGTNAFVNLDAPFGAGDIIEGQFPVAADSRPRGTGTGQSSTGTNATLGIIGAAATESPRETFLLQAGLSPVNGQSITTNNISPLNGTRTACTTADCTLVAAYGSIDVRAGDQVLADTFFTFQGAEAGMPNNEFRVVAVERTADMSVLAGVTSATYTGRTQFFNDEVIMNVNFAASTFTGTVSEIANVNSTTTSGLNLATTNGSITGNAFSATAFSVTGEGGGTATGVWEGNFGGPQAQAAAGRIDVDITTNTLDVDVNTGGTQNEIKYNDVFVLGFDNRP